jgi:hypothetical protein
VASNDIIIVIVNSKACDRKKSQSILKYYSSVCIDSEKNYEKLQEK